MSVKLNLSPGFQKAITNYDNAYKKFPAGKLEDAKATEIELKNRYFRLVNSRGALTAQKTLHKSLERNHPEAFQQLGEWEKKLSSPQSPGQKRLRSASSAVFDTPESPSPKRVKYTFSDVIEKAKAFQDSRSGEAAKLFTDLKAARKEFKELLTTELKTLKVDEIEKFMSEKSVSVYVIEKMKNISAKNCT